MASNDYYNQFHQQDTSYHNHQAGRTNQPLPPIPSSPSTRPPNPYIDTTGIAPVTSPFEDTTYPAYPRPSQSYNHMPDYTDSPPPGNAKHQPHDPFRDSNAIPLQSQQSLKAGGNVASSPTSAMGEAEQQYGSSERRRRRRNSRSRRGERRKKDGWFRGKITWAVFFLTLVQLIVFIVELVRNAQLTGTPIAIRPNFNPMIGPSPYVLINLGARYVPCMRRINATIGGQQVSVANSLVSFQCPNTTTTAADCHLADLCGFGLNLDVKPDGTQPQPNQWYRFIIPIFLHGGIIHIGFNMLLQLTLGRDIELQIGTLRFLLVYLSAGIFGFVFGGNFAANGLPSTGCSGSLFGIIALVLLDLLYTWKTRTSPWRDFLFIMLDIIISFIIGLLPALDNFSHIGGFLMGLCLGICILHSPNSLRERIGLDEPPYAEISRAYSDGAPDQKTAARNFVKQPVGFFKGRKPLWWGWWLLRAGALVGVLIAFVLLIRNFYVFEQKCRWCKYLSCLPIKNWCEIGNLQLTDESTSKSKRVLGRLVADALW
ncbi:rhomboid-domain-containing protein [Tothia fuscella]|uniref:Rhomboid-type serine protease n=1 Tax=Tothia fuscella TaxID=1048955 RepID=A0A9P4TVR6_9PEZI|nr:rhomboid-domain-containing protein [Tothia fuscella]